MSRQSKGPRYLSCLVTIGQGINLFNDNLLKCLEKAIIEFPSKVIHIVEDCFLWHQQELFCWQSQWLQQIGHAYIQI